MALVALAGVLVVALIVVFGTAAFSLTKVNERAHQTRTLASLTQLRIAIHSYQMEYLRLPAIQGGEPVPADSDGVLLRTLLGEARELNPRGIAFLSPPVAREGKAGLTGEGDSRVLVDDWGTPYRILLDTSGSNRIPDPRHPGSTVNDIVLIWSAGPDQDFDTWEDNLTSW